MVYDQLPEGVTRETMDVDVLIVGGGAAGLSCALRLQNQIEKHNADVAAGTLKAEPIPEQMIVVLEKSITVTTVGDVISGEAESGVLTNREIEIVRLIEKELNNKQIADKLFISERTVETHRKNIFRKTKTQSIQ
ncbi:MAG: FAD-binding protein [Sphingobacteriales bacterium]|nr:MAG: FAD-binding protein [Sphingobacteriales bacterium]